MIYKITLDGVVTLFIFILDLDSDLTLFHYYVLIFGLILSQTENVAMEHQLDHQAALWLYVTGLYSLKWKGLGITAS